MAKNRSNPVGLMREIRSRTPDVPFETVLRQCRPESHATIVELACIDLIDRIRSGATVQVEQYLNGVPELREDVDDMLDLIDAEICTQRELGQTPTATDYKQRFPHLANEVERLFVLDSVESQLESSAIPVRDRFPVVNNYRLTRQICSDSVSTTYRARNTGRQSCLLRLFEAGSRDDRLLNDALNVLTPPTPDMAHPSVLSIRDLGAEGDQVFYTTDLADGLPLSKLIANGLAPRKVAGWLNSILMAVAFTESQNRSLGHVCASHVLIDHKDQPRIVGYGQPANDGDTDTVKTDTTNVGLLMFHMLTGQLYNVQSDDVDAGGNTRENEHSPTTRTRTIDPVLEYVCLRCLGLAEPKYTELTAISKDLTQFLSERQISVPRESTGYISRLLR